MIGCVTYVNAINSVKDASYRMIVCVRVIANESHVTQILTLVPCSLLTLSGVVYGMKRSLSHKLLLVSSNVYLSPRELCFIE